MVSIPFAAPKQQYKVAEPKLVKDVVRVLQGFSGEKIVWDQSLQMFILKKRTHVLDLSEASLALILQPFLSAATSMRRVEKFISKFAQSLNAVSRMHRCPTLEAFATAASMRLKHLRKTVLNKDVEATLDEIGSTVTLLNISAKLSWVCAAAYFLDHTVMNAVPEEYMTYDAANLSSYILSFLYDSMNSFCLLKDGEEEAYRTLLLLFMGSLWPLIYTLDTWLHEGSLSDPFGELFFYANTSVSVEDSAYWQNGYHLRFEAERKNDGSSNEAKESERNLACPIFLQALARSMLSCGKSLQLLRHEVKGLVGYYENGSMFDQLWKCLRVLLVADASDSVQAISASCTVEYQLTQIPTLDDNDLRESIFTSGCIEYAAETDYLLGSGFGNVLQNHMLTNGQALKPLFPSPTSLPHLQEGGLLSDFINCEKNNQIVTKMIEWLQDVELMVTPSSRILVQECVISSIEKQMNEVGKQLLEKLMGPWHLMEQLALLRAIYLMGSGDLLQQFTFVLFNKLDRGDPWDDFYELNTMLQESVRSSADGVMHSCLDSLVLKMISRSSGSERNSPYNIGRNQLFGIDILDKLRFEYKVAWPLELIIDDEAIRKYNQVMGFLLKVKRAKFALDKACRWMWKRDRTHKQQLLLQMKLMHFVNTLHHYVMDQVLHSSWVELCDGMSSARSLDEVISCHDAYLTSIQRQCFVAPDKLWTLIASRVKTVLGLALDFYSIQRTLNSGGAMAATCQGHVDNVGKQYDECIAFLLRVLSFKLNVGHFPHLTDLITRINYNNFYMSENGQLLAPVPNSNHK